MKIDILLVLGDKPKSEFAVTGVGIFFTASTIDGGSKGTIKLFQKLLQLAKRSNTAAVDAVIAERDAKAVKAAGARRPGWRSAGHVLSRGGGAEIAAPAHDGL